MPRKELGERCWENVLGHSVSAKGQVGGGWKYEVWVWGKGRRVGGGLSLKLRIREKILRLLRFGRAGAKEIVGVGGRWGSGPFAPMVPGAWGYIETLRKSAGFNKSLL